MVSEFDPNVTESFNLVSLETMHAAGFDICRKPISLFCFNERPHYPPREDSSQKNREVNIHNIFKLNVMSISAKKLISSSLGCTL